MVGTTNRSIAAIPSAWLRRNVFHPCDGGAHLRAIYLATLVWPISMPSLSNSPWILGAPHNGLAMLISRISRRISNGTVGRPQRRLDFQRQYDLKPARCQRITVSGRTIASASYILGNSRQIPPNISLSIEMKGCLLGRVRRNTLICCLKIRISVASALVTAAGRSPFQRSVCTNPTSSSSIARFSINRQQDWIYGQDKPNGVHNCARLFRQP